MERGRGIVGDIAGGYAGGPHTVARTAVIWQVLRQELARAGGRLTIVDVGGGTGGFSVPLAAAGHDVTVVDASPDALAALTRRAAEAGAGGSVRAVQGDADTLTELVALGSADLVLCHNVLEVVDAPRQAATAIAGILRPGGSVSVLVANRAAAVLAKAMAGQLDVAAALLDDPDGRAGERDTVRRRFDLESATALLAGAGLSVVQAHGVRVVADLVSGEALERDQDALAAFELAAAERAPFRDVASQLHLLARRP